MKSRKLDVSVIMPAFNAAQTVEAAILSVLGQKGVDFELLVGNDGSTDETWARIQHHRGHPRIHAVRFNKNRGASFTRNRLIAKARGRYLAFCDADDQLLAGHLKRLTKILDEKKSFGAVYGDCYLSDRQGRRRLAKRPFVFNKQWDLLGGVFAHGGSVVRRSLLRKIKGYRKNLKFLEDCDLFLRLSEVTRFYYYRGNPLYLCQKRKKSLSDQPRHKNKKVSQQILRETIQRRYGYTVRW